MLQFDHIAIELYFSRIEFAQIDSFVMINKMVLMMQEQGGKKIYAKRQQNRFLNYHYLVVFNTTVFFAAVPHFYFVFLKTIMTIFSIVRAQILRKMS